MHMVESSVKWATAL